METKDNRTNANSAARNDIDHHTKAVPAIKPILDRLLKGETLHTQDIIKKNNGEQHRVAIAISRLRHKYGFKDLIQCPRGCHPSRYRYFIAPSDMKEALELAVKLNLLGVKDE